MRQKRYVRYALYHVFMIRPADEYGNIWCHVIKQQLHAIIEENKMALLPRGKVVV